jgi:hypothetical protein
MVADRRSGNNIFTQTLPIAKYGNKPDKSPRSPAFDDRSSPPPAWKDPGITALTWMFKLLSAVIPVTTWTQGDQMIAKQTMWAMSASST